MRSHEAVAELMLERACLKHNLTYPSANCTGDISSQDLASRRLSYYNLATSMPALLTVAGVAMTADAYGRKPAAVLPYTGSMLATLAVASLPATDIAGMDSFFVLLGATFRRFSTAFGPIFD